MRLPLVVLTITGTLGCAPKPAPSRPTTPAATEQQAPAPVADHPPAAPPTAEGETAEAEEREPPRPPARPISVVAVGDMMFGTTYPDRSGGSLPPDGAAGLLAPVGEILRGADVTFGNLEGPMFDGEGDGKCAYMKKRRRGKRQTCWAFRQPTEYAAQLAKAGFDLISVANNHTWDFGEEGRDSTIAALDEAGVAYSGPPGTVGTVNAGNMTIGMVAFATANHSHNLNDIDAAVAAVRAADKNHDLVFVSFHGGAEGKRHQHVPNGPETFYGEDRGDLRKFSRAVIDAGADLVIGHGPHVLRGLEVYNGRLIAYSLGNFATYRGISIRGPAGISAILEARLDTDGRFMEGKLHPVKQRRPKGTVIDDDGSGIDKVKELSEADFGDTAPIISDDGSLLPPGVAK